MKKKALIAGVASFAVAAVPIVGAFAACDPQTDTLVLTVSPLCNFTRSSGSATKSTSMAMNALDTSMTNTFNVVCNNAAGFSVGATFTALEGPGTDIVYTGTASQVTAGSGKWTALKGEANSTDSIAASSGVLMSASGVTSTSGVTQKVTYKVGSASNQAAGSYEGTATYTVTQL